MSYSKDCLNRLVADTGIDYDGRRTASSTTSARRRASTPRTVTCRILRDEGLTLERVDRDAMREIEPVMARTPEVAGGIYSPDCQTGDAPSSPTTSPTGAWRKRATSLFYDAPIRRLIVEGDRVVEAQTDRGDVAADVFVLAAGAESVFLAGDIDIRLPIYPVKGFSITAPLARPEDGPRMGLVDEDRLVAMSPFGGRLRAASSAVFGGFDYGHRPEDFRTILELTRALYGDAVDYSQPFTGPACVR